MIQFSNTEISFQYKSDKELKKSLIIFRYLFSGFMLEFGKFAVNFALKLNLPIRWAVKPLIFHQFCGGENIAECSKVISTLAKYNVKSILDYSVEGKSVENEIMEVFHETIETINQASKNKNISFAVFKPSAFAPKDILEKASQKKLSEKEEIAFQFFVDKVDKLCSHASKQKVKLLVDAEHFSFQQIVDDVTFSMMKKHNSSEVYIFNTLQMYRSDRLLYLQEVIQCSKNEKFKLGIKLVRGAYMENERKLAQEKKYLSPIFKTKEETNITFNNAVKLCVENIEILNLFCGTHNEDSCLLLTELMAMQNISKNDDRIFFAQLYGMSDNISFNLSKEGYNVAKYIPYGPVKEVMPYLLRRADENSSVKGQSSRELELIIREVKRRNL
ncbi:MAG TPA: proline dehydrogenase [Bacteroidales bacterium]|nr:MAG: hypothetical protein A2W98_13940 [Bacteroidetes bacterium GWF2_33_38]OFY74263.1 MAG: hypothetical protein A2265_01025 [Bacteroidetes bacterium RIFOXYA12_FULL_33_9]OFY86221.1 MAG: hypothetical protein A2236_13915 [Bacteroidetes bacterium RIFOXYA2_FULL_33_7]HBF89226.1 proline dehydrogenase [Bacteroidales bacterium]